MVIRRAPLRHGENQKQIPGNVGFSLGSREQKAERLNVSEKDILSFTHLQEQ